MDQFIPDLNSLNVTKYGSFGELVSGLVQLAMLIATIVAIAMLIYTGFLYIFSKGDESKIGEAQKSLIYTIVGLILVFVAPALLSFVLNRVIGVSL